jgi:hypothetical protein
MIAEKQTAHVNQRQQPLNSVRCGCAVGIRGNRHQVVCRIAVSAFNGTAPATEMVDTGLRVFADITVPEGMLRRLDQLDPRHAAVGGVIHGRAGKIR